MQVQYDGTLRLADGRLFGKLAEDGRVHGPSGHATPPSLAFSPSNPFRDASGRAIVRVDEMGVFRSSDGRPLATVDPGVFFFE